MPAHGRRWRHIVCRSTDPAYSTDKQPVYLAPDQGRAFHCCAPTPGQARAGSVWRRAGVVRSVAIVSAARTPGAGDLPEKQHQAPIGAQHEIVNAPPTAIACSVCSTISQPGNTGACSRQQCIDDLTRQRVSPVRGHRVCSAGMLRWPINTATPAAGRIAPKPSRISKRSTYWRVGPIRRSQSCSTTSVHGVAGIGACAATISRPDASRNANGLGTHRHHRNPAIGGSHIADQRGST